MSSSKGNTLEIVLNVVLADQLRRQGLEAEAEQFVQGDKGRHQVDLLVELGEVAVAIEAEFAPARTVRADAEKRLPERPLVWRQLPVESVFTLVYPESLKKLPESRAKDALGSCETLEFALVRRRGAAEAADSADGAGARQTGSVATFAECLHDYWIRTARGASVEDVVQQASFAIERASELIRRGMGQRPSPSDESDPAAATALIWLNALLFQELLAQNLDPSGLPPRHRQARIPRPDREGKPSVLLQQWEEILAINWWPIFHVARKALQEARPRPAALALAGLVATAVDIAERGVIRRHDVAGRIFHRLLGTRKFLATNYTTIPAAALLAGLAFDRDHPLWQGRDWSRSDELGQLRIIDPACGSGTLLMAALQEALRLHRRAGVGGGSEGAAMQALLEQALHGYDVVPAAIHLTAATLSMAETRQVIANMPLYWMPHDVRHGKPRLGSLDFLDRSLGKGQAQYLPLLAEAGHDPERVTGSGDRTYDVAMPTSCDLVIANPPYTRAGGPGTAENSAWNPIFGSVLSKADAARMQVALRRALHGTPASLYAGLGSAFVVLAHEKLKPGGRLAFVLPATALTGSRWGPVRELLARDFDVEWVVVSHDARSRHAKANLPGRLHSGFSESTRIAETLIVATKKAEAQSAGNGFARFVNLRRNPDEPIDAMAVTRALLALPAPTRDLGTEEVAVGDTVWGEAVFVNRRKLARTPWWYSAFRQGWLVQVASRVLGDGKLRVGDLEWRVPVAKLSSLCDLGPYHMQVKNPTHGLFDIVASGDPTRPGHPALWHHQAKRITSLETGANARLRERRGVDSDRQSAMLARAGRLHVASELRHAPQRLAAVLTDERMIGVSSWITLRPSAPGPGKEEALCLWLNSTPGLLLRILHSNRPYLGRSRLPHELAEGLPVLDVNSLTKAQTAAAQEIFNDLKSKQLQGFAHLFADPVRREIDHRLCRDVLGQDAPAAIDRLAQALNREPTLTVRH